MTQAFRSGTREEFVREARWAVMYLSLTAYLTRHIGSTYRTLYTSKRQVLIECKGFFRVGDTQKYTAMRDYASTTGS